MGTMIRVRTISEQGEKITSHIDMSDAWREMREAFERGQFVHVAIQGPRPKVPATVDWVAIAVRASTERKLRP